MVTEEEKSQANSGESSIRFSEVLHGTSKNYKVDAPGVISPKEIGLNDVLDNGSVTKITAMFNIGSEENPRAAAVVTMYNTTDDIYRVSIGGLGIDENGKLKLNNSWQILEKGASVVIGKDGDRNPDSVVGSEGLWPGTGYFDADVSDVHLSITFNGENVNILDTSQTGTKLYGDAPKTSEQEPDDDFGHLSTHTMTAKDSARIAQLLKEDKNGQELYSKRPVIDRSTTDPEGMVDIRSWVGGGEAIVVDSEKVPTPYIELVQKCEQKLQEKGVFSEQDMMQAIFESVSETMDYDLEYANNRAASIDTKSKKINLADYLADGKGVCRHMALAGQWLGARMAEKYPELLGSGEFTVPVNQREVDNAAHEWIRYTNPKGKVYIIDVAQKFVGTLEDVVHDTNSGFERWEYFRDPEEKERYEKILLGDTALRVSSSFYRKKRQ